MSGWENKKELRLGARSISLPLFSGHIYRHTDFTESERFDSPYKKLSKDEIAWAEFLIDKGLDYGGYCCAQDMELSEALEKEQNPLTRSEINRLINFFREQDVCAMLLVERCRNALRFQSSEQAELAEVRFELARVTAENEALKDELEKLKRSAQLGVKGEEIERIRYEMEKLRMSLEYEEKKNFGLSEELSSRHAELLFMRQEMEELRAQSSESFRLRPMWRYVLELEQQGKPVDVIREALHGDGFSYPAADALLYDGEATTYDAVKKWGQRNFPRK